MNSAAGKLNVVLANDTDVRGQHFGCSRVMRIIEDNLTRRGATISGRIPAGFDWRSDRASRDLLARADLVLVNGEGTLHHGSRKGAWLLELADTPDLDGIPKVLINALYQENPLDWADMLSGFDLISARDSRSAETMTIATGRPVDFVPDLSMCEAVATPPQAGRNGILVGDSVHGPVSKALLGLAGALQSHPEPVQVVPLTTGFRIVNPNRPLPNRLFRRASLALRRAVAVRRHGYLNFVSTEQEYLNLLSACRLTVTGRFHAVCMAIATGTPFVAISSNSWKIESLLRDAGLDPARIVSVGDLNTALVTRRPWDFSETELRNIAAFLDRGRQKADNLFDRICKVDF